MSRYKLINLFDKVFITISIFLIIFAWINFFIRNLFATFILSLIFSSAVVFLVFYLSNKKTVKKNINKKYLQDIDEKFLVFRLLSKTKQLYLLHSILNIKYPTRIINDYIVYKINNKKHLILIATNEEKITNFNFINLIQGKDNVDRIEIICNDFEPNINTKILNQIDIVFTDKKKLYDEYFSKNSLYPVSQNINKNKTNLTWKIVFKNLFIPSRAKSYFFCGLILIFSSIILPYHYYYLIFGSILLIFGIICKIRPFLSR